MATHNDPVTRGKSHPPTDGIDGYTVTPEPTNSLALTMEWVKGIDEATGAEVSLKFNLVVPQLRLVITSTTGDIHIEAMDLADMIESWADDAQKRGFGHG